MSNSRNAQCAENSSRDIFHLLNFCFKLLKTTIEAKVGKKKMSRPSERHSTNDKNAVKGTEVFVGGLPKSISEEKIQKVFSACGEIVEIRTIKDPKGKLKGFCFVRFATKEAAARAVKEKSGTVLDGKKIGVLPSNEQDTLYFGNLNKAWGADEFQRIVLQVFSDIESVDLAMLKDTPPGQKQRNRGFAFVKFYSHAAAARAQRVGSQPDFRLGNSHPAIQWAEEEPEIDSEELAKIKIAFVRNLPVDAEENYLKQLFEPLGKVEKVVVSKKGSSPVAFVHFAARSDLERAVNELNEKTVQGPNGGPTHKLQVEVARPQYKNKKRVREDSESNSSLQGHSKLLKEELSVALPNNHNSHVRRELESADPYEDAVIALPLAVKERLLRILRLGIASRYDIDVKSLCDLKELPESIAISVLDQFMLSGAASQNKGAYLAGLISKHLVDQAGLRQSSVVLPRVADTSGSDSELLSILHRMSPPAAGLLPSHAHSTAARSDIYAPRHPSLLSDNPLSSRTLLRRADERVSEFHISNRSQDLRIPIVGRPEDRSHSPYDSIPGSSLSYGRIGLRTEDEHLPYGRIGLRTEEEHLPYGRIGLRNQEQYLPPVQTTRIGLRNQEHLSHVQAARIGLRNGEQHPSPVQAARIELRNEEWHQPPVLTAPSSSTSYARLGIGLHSETTATVGGHQASRPQIRFDPFTGVPYKFDPFTGEPIHPGNTTRQF